MAHQTKIGSIAHFGKEWSKNHVFSLKTQKSQSTFFISVHLFRLFYPFVQVRVILFIPTRCISHPRPLYSHSYSLRPLFQFTASFLSETVRFIRSFGYNSFFSATLFLFPTPLLTVFVFYSLTLATIFIYGY